MIKEKESNTNISDDSGDLRFVIRRHPISKQNVVYKTIEASVDDIADGFVPFDGIGKKTP